MLLIRYSLDVKFSTLILSFTMLTSPRPVLKSIFAGSGTSYASTDSLVGLESAHPGWYGKACLVVVNSQGSARRYRKSEKILCAYYCGLTPGSNNPIWSSIICNLKAQWQTIPHPLKAVLRICSAQLLHRQAYPEQYAVRRVYKFLNDHILKSLGVVVARSSDFGNDKGLEVGLQEITGYADPIC